jgi:hypothetical protein
MKIIVHNVGKVFIWAMINNKMQDIVKNVINPAVVVNIILKIALNAIILVILMIQIIVNHVMQLV